MGIYGNVALALLIIYINIDTVLVLLPLIVYCLCVLQDSVDLRAIIHETYGCSEIKLYNRFVNSKS